MVAEEDSKRIKGFVRKHYGEIARKRSQSCCGPSAKTAARGRAPHRAPSFYSGEEIAPLPSSVVEMSLGCGNPTAIAGLKPGEVVLDLGSGGGIDCFLAAEKVGARGQVIGLDMTPEMVSLAKRNARRLGVSNVQFRLGEMERMPIENNSVDVIISNCVINLSPDKEAVFREAFRVLRPGGRLCVSDIVLMKELPDALRESFEAWAGCIAGALPKETYLEKIRGAGFIEVEEQVVRPAISEQFDKDQTVNPEAVPVKLSDILVSVAVTAKKPLP